MLQFNVVWCIHSRREIVLTIQSDNGKQGYKVGGKKYRRPKVVLFQRPLRTVLQRLDSETRGILSSQRGIRPSRKSSVTNNKQQKRLVTYLVRAVSSLQVKCPWAAGQINSWYCTSMACWYLRGSFSESMIMCCGILGPTVAGEDRTRARKKSDESCVDASCLPRSPLLDRIFYWLFPSLLVEGK